MKNYYANSLKFITFSVRAKNRLAFFVYLTKNFQRIEASKLTLNLAQFNLEKVILVYVTNYRTTTSFTVINKNLSLLTVSIEEFLEDTASFNLIFNISEDKNIVFLFKDIDWTHITQKIRNTGYKLYSPDIEVSPLSLKFTRFLNSLNGLLVPSIFKSFSETLDKNWDDESWREYIEIVPIETDKDLSKDSFLILDIQPISINYENIDKEIDNFLD